MDRKDYSNFFPFVLVIAICIVITSGVSNPYYEILTFGLEVLERNCAGNQDKIRGCTLSHFENHDDNTTVSEGGQIVGPVCFPKSHPLNCMSEHWEIIGTSTDPETKDFNSFLHNLCMVDPIKTHSLLQRFFQMSGQNCLRDMKGYFEDCTKLIRTQYKENPIQYYDNCEFLKTSFQCLNSGILTCKNVELENIMMELSQLMKHTPMSTCYSELFHSKPCCTSISDCNPLPNCRAEAGCCSIPNCDPSDECPLSNSTSTCCPEGPGCNTRTNCNLHEGCCKDMENCVFDPTYKQPCKKKYLGDEDDEDDGSIIIKISPNLLFWSLILSSIAFLFPKL